MTEAVFPLWSDEPSGTDLLSFDAVATTLVDAIFDEGLDPIALGLSGSWGSGKTTVLSLVQAEIERRSKKSASSVLVIPVEPWRFDPSLGPKESLISEVLTALAGEIREAAGTGDKAKKLLSDLAKRVNWAKALKMAAMTSMTLQLPKPEDLLGLIKEGAADELGGERGLGKFREEFAKLLESDELSHVSRVVVLVDDLDRCLPDTVVETLESIRLFLSAKGMSFVLAADEERVADAIRRHLGGSPVPPSEEEDVATLYLHKIVQTTIPLPGLSRFDTQAYLFLLLSRAKVGEPEFNQLVAQCAAVRQSGGSVDDLELPKDVDLTEALTTAGRLTPILYEKFKGNPRRIKRFLNDLNVRLAVARRRGIKLPTDAVAKLMVLERLLPEDFKLVLDWLATGQLRDRLEALDAIANKGVAASAPNRDTAKTPSTSSAAKRVAQKKPAEDVSPAADETGLTDTLVRWAKLPPVLDATDVSGYLYLAASFARIELIDEGLPQRLRDIAAALTSGLKVDRAAVTDDDLRALSESDAQLLVSFLGKRTRDQPSLQKFTVSAILRLVDVHPTVTPSGLAALKILPIPDIEPATALKFKALPVYRSVLEAWKTGNGSHSFVNAVTLVIDGWDE
ncbi:KAP family P-loop NTPase fold protein [Jatrophihabitans sp. DSM 45814]